MMMLIVIAACVLALALSFEYSITDPVGSRLSRFIPIDVEAESESAEQKKKLDLIRRGLKLVDPSFARGEPMLRALGVTSLKGLVAAETAKLAGAAAFAWTVSRLDDTVVGPELVEWGTPIAAFVLFIVMVNRIVESASLRRRKWIRQELVLGVEILCVLLEGGQSLDQAFRSFYEISARALPRLAPIQRTLITELNNGVSYAKAYEHWAENVDADEARPLASLFIDSLIHGTELVPHLKQFSLNITEQRIAATRATIGVKSSQLTVVMMVFFVPTILGLVMAPAIAGIAATLGGLR